MEIRDLAQTSPASIYETFQEAFSDYYLPMNESFEDNLERWENAGVSLKNSFGAFIDDRLVGFMLNAPQENGLIYNFATGVIPEMRGEQVMDEIYGPALPMLKDAGFETIRLEVLLQNFKAQKLYERMGFSQNRRLLSFRGQLPQRIEDLHHLRYHVKNVVFTEEMKALVKYAWSTEHGQTTVMRGQKIYELHELREDDRLVAYAIYRPQYLRLIQLEARPPFSHYARILLGRMKLSGEEISMLNIDEKNMPLLECLHDLGLNVEIDQWEMERKL